MTDLLSGSETQEGQKKQPVTQETKEWSSSLDTDLPISGADLPNFRAWVNWNGFQLDKESGEGHDGYDFAAYVTNDGSVVFGLPENTPVRAVADGTVRQVMDNFPEVTGGGYGVFINVEHGADDSGLFSSYHHVKPLVEQGKAVKKGEIIGALYQDPPGHEGRLVHLHMMLIDGWGTHGTSITGGGKTKRTVDPGLINGTIYEHKAEPLGSASFTVPSLGDANVKVANYQKVKVNS